MGDRAMFPENKVLWSMHGYLTLGRSFSCGTFLLKLDGSIVLKSVVWIIVRDLGRIPELLSCSLCEL